MVSNASVSDYYSKNEVFLLVLPEQVPEQFIEYFK